MNSTKDEYSEKETARRRDEVIRRMANTPPQPKTTAPLPKKKTKAGEGRAARRGRERREG